MTKNYQEKLVELAREANNMTDVFFEFNQHRPNTNSQRTESEMFYISKLKQLFGFISVLEDEEISNDL